MVKRFVVPAPVSRDSEGARMKRLVTCAVLILASTLFIASPAHAGPDDFFADFTDPPDLYFTNYEDGVRSAHTQCGVDACAYLESQGSTDYLRVAVAPTATPGYYTNTDVSQVDLEGTFLTDTGPYTATYGHPVTLTARIKWSATYDFAGEGPAVGTSGVVLWNSAFDNPGDLPNAQYDQIGFTWANEDAMLGLIAGFRGSTFVNQAPIGAAQPTSSVNIRNWMNVTMVWSADAQGAQTVAYYLENTLFGQHSLPVALEGLSLEIWNDNQEPNLCGNPPTICWAYPNPNVTQSFYVDYVSVTQD
jgi:hypothetical protein